MVDAEFRSKHIASAGWRWKNVRAVPLAGEDGSIEKCSGMNLDIHDRKLAEEAVRESEERLKSATEVGRKFSLVFELENWKKFALAECVCLARNRHYAAYVHGSPRLEEASRDPLSILMTRPGSCTVRTLTCQVILAPLKLMPQYFLLLRALRSQRVVSVTQITTKSTSTSLDRTANIVENSLEK